MRRSWWREARFTSTVTAIGADESFFVDSNGDDIFCGAGIDTVRADAEDRVAAGCEVVFRPSSLQAPGATPEAEGTITTPEWTITMPS